jgi:integrase
MIKRGVNPEIVRRQMRHKNVSTTLRIYTQVRTEELEASLPTRPKSIEINSDSNVIKFRMKGA